MMRKLMWFTIGFSAACAMGVNFLQNRWFIPLIILSLLLVPATRKKGLLKVTAILLGCALGFICYLLFQRYYLVPAIAMDGTNLETTVTATGYSYDTTYGVGVDGEFEEKGRTYRVRLYVNDALEIRPGDTITGTFQMRYTAPGGLNDSTHHASDGILFLGYQRGYAEIRSAVESAKEYWASRMNWAVSDLLAELFPQDVTPFAQALLLGNDDALDYETDTALRISGIRHVVAVSGLHVAILYMMLRAVTLNHRFLTALIGIPVLYLFCAVAHFSPSVSRAGIMVALMILSQLIDREYDAPTALSLSVLVMLIHNPLVITSIGLQMSVACVAGILLFQQRITGWFYEKLGAPRGKNIRSRLKTWFVSSVSVSLSATVMTSPLSAFYFGTVSLVGILTNLLTLWAVTAAFCGIAVVLVLGIFWKAGAAALAWVVSMVLRYVLWMANLLESFPLASLYTQSIYIVIWLVFVYLLLIIFLTGKKRRTMVLCCCAVISLCAALMLSWTEHTFADVHVTALDVGQGQSLILHSEGKTYLIDCGGSNDEIAANMAAETLLSRGITHLDGIMLTHGDRDHAGGIPYLLTRMDAEFIMVPATTQEQRTAQLLGNSDAVVIPVADKCNIDFGDAEITVFGPIFAPESNENSLCVLFERENCAILVTGDRGQLGEMLLLQEAQLPQVDLFIAGHHGSKNSNSTELLRTIHPACVIISVGEHNGYGHPADETLQRFAQFGCRVYRTDQMGTIIFRR